VGWLSRKLKKKWHRGKEKKKKKKGPKRLKPRTDPEFWGCFWGGKTGQLRTRASRVGRVIRAPNPQKKMGKGKKKKKKKTKPAKPFFRWKPRMSVQNRGQNKNSKKGRGTNCGYKKITTGAFPPGWLSYRPWGLGGPMKILKLGYGGKKRFRWQGNVQENRGHSL